LTLDTIQSYTFSDLEGKVIVIKDDDDNIRFTGKTLKAKLSIDKKTMQLPFTDKWQEIKNTSCDNKNLEKHEPENGDRKCNCHDNRNILQRR